MVTLCYPILRLRVEASRFPECTTSNYVFLRALPLVSGRWPIGLELRSKESRQEHSLIDRSRVRNVQEEIQ